METQKIVYAYDPITFEYTGEIEAQESPLEEGIFLDEIPNTSKNLPPVVIKNQIAVLVNEKWEIQPDFRGEVWFNQNTKEAIEIVDIGQPDIELAKTLPALTIAELKNIQKTKIEDAFNTSINNVVSYKSTTFKINSYALIAFIITSTGNSLPAGFLLFDSKDVKMELTLAELKELASTINTVITTALKTKAARYDAIALAKTASAIQGIVW